MQWAPIKLTYHVRSYAFGDRLIPEMLGKADAPDGVVAETWEVSDQRDARATITEGPFAGRLLHDLVEAHPRTARVRGPSSQTVSPPLSR